MGKMCWSPKAKLFSLCQRKHMFEHFRRGCEYAETVVENARIYNAAMIRTFECNTDGTSLDGYVIDCFDGGD